MNNKEPIQVMIPYDLEPKLGKAYNRAMERATTEWVLFMDQDLFIPNKHWYHMMCEAIEKAPPKTGWISAVTNRIGNPDQRAVGAPMSHNIVDHCNFAKIQYQMYGSKIERCRGAMSGFWILTNKTAWGFCGGFNEDRKMLGVDNDYSRSLAMNGYSYFKMPGLYVYHFYREKQLYMRW